MNAPFQHYSFRCMACNPFSQFKNKPLTVGSPFSSESTLSLRARIKMTEGQEHNDDDVDACLLSMESTSKDLLLSWDGACNMIHTSTRWVLSIGSIAESSSWRQIEPIARLFLCGVTSSPYHDSHGYNPGPVCRDHLKIFLSSGNDGSLASKTANDGSSASKTANDGNSASATSNGTQGKVLQSIINARSAN